MGSEQQVPVWLLGIGPARLAVREVAALPHGMAARHVHDRSFRAPTGAPATAALDARRFGNLCMSMGQDGAFIAMLIGVGRVRVKSSARAAGSSGRDESATARMKMAQCAIFKCDPPEARGKYSEVLWQSVAGAYYSSRGS